MGLRKILGGVFGSIISRNQHRIYMSAQVVERIEREMEAIQGAQEQFAKAMMQYTEVLESHTTAMQGLSEASHKLSKNAAEQNKLITRLMEFLEQPTSEVAKVIPELELVPKVENIVFPPGCYRRRRLQKKDEQVLSIR